MPFFLHLIAWLSIGSGVTCAIWLAVDVSRAKPAMAIMRLVWPICALFGSVMVVVFYFRHGRSHCDRHSKNSLWLSAATGSLHCGSGCTLGDLLAETVIFLWPVVGTVFGYAWLVADPMYAGWLADTLFAMTLGIGFQYWAIEPMSDLSRRQVLWQAFKADVASLAAWQIGMFAVMWAVQTHVYPALLGSRPRANSPLFWWAMQWAMFGGFAASYPVNVLLIRLKIKEAM